MEIQDWGRGTGIRKKRCEQEGLGSHEAPIPNLRRSPSVVVLAPPSELQAGEALAWQALCPGEKGAG